MKEDLNHIKMNEETSKEGGSIKASNPASCHTASGNSSEAILQNYYPNLLYS